MINWKHYVDQIYCITFTGKDKTDLYKELDRVDILHSGIFYEFENIQTPFYKILYDNVVGNKYENSEILAYSYRYDCTMAHYYCMKHAQQHNYKNILILENDVIFLRNKEDIVNILENQFIIQQYNNPGYIFLGSAAHSIYDYEYERKNYRNTCYQCSKEIDTNILKFSESITIAGGAAFNIYDSIAYSYFIDFIEEGNFDVIDIYHRIYKNSNISIYFSNTYVCIQEGWFGLFLNATYNYDYNHDKKEEYLNHIFEDYHNYAENQDKWVHPLLFKEINEAMFNNSLTDYYYIDKINEFNITQ